jgi:PhnB protein
VPQNERMSKAKPIPEGYHSVTPYLTVQGVRKLMNFMTQAFGAKETFRTNRPDGTVWHAEMQIGDSRVMLGEANEQWKARPSALYLYVEDVDGVYRQAVEAGGKSLGEPATHQYGDRSGGVEDPCGNQWWIATHVEDVSAEEFERRMKTQKASG